MSKNQNKPIKIIHKTKDDDKTGLRSLVKALARQMAEEDCAKELEAKNCKKNEN